MYDYIWFLFFFVIFNPRNEMMTFKDGMGGWAKNCSHGLNRLGYTQRIWDIISGWWFGTWILWPSIQLGMSSSQLTNSNIFQRVGIPPTRYDLMGFNWDEPTKHRSFLVCLKGPPRNSHLFIGKMMIHQWIQVPCSVKPTEFNHVGNIWFIAMFIWKHVNGHTRQEWGMNRQNLSFWCI